LIRSASRIGKADATLAVAAIPAPTRVAAASLPIGFGMIVPPRFSSYPTIVAL
jgi:hypothetical protein